MSPGGPVGGPDREPRSAVKQGCATLFERTGPSRFSPVRPHYDHAVTNPALPADTFLAPPPNQTPAVATAGTPDAEPAARQESGDTGPDPEYGPGPTEWGDNPNGVGPWTAEYDGPPPEDDRLDPVLLAEGDRRNVVDAYRYWTREAIVADIDRRRHPFHVAIENFGHDANIGTVVRTANAFAAGAVHIVGRRRWNRRGAMVTDRYQHITHHSDIEALLEFARSEDLSVVAVDNVPGSVPLETVRLPRRCLLLFGQEGPGVTESARDAAVLTVSIAQFGSTRSINAGVAAGIAMHTWVRQHADLTTAW